MFDIILNHPTGYLLGLFIEKLGSFGLGLIAFTVLIKIICIPLGILQHRSTLKQMRVRPKEEAIRKEFAGDKLRANTEVSQLYKDNGVSVSAGCLPTLVQMPIILALYKVLRMPLTYIVKMPAETIAAIDTYLKLGIYGTKSVTAEVTIAGGLFNNFAELVQAGIVPATTKLFDYHFLGLDLSVKPSFAINAMLLIPLFAGLTAYLQSWYQAKTMPPAPSAEGMQRSMTLTMPLLSVWIAFSMPGAIGLYWSLSNVLAFVQAVISNAIASPRKALEEAYAAIEEEERLAKELRLASRKPNLGGVKPGETPAADRVPLPPKTAEQLEAEKAARRERERRYAKTLNFKSIPSPFDDEDE